MTSAWTLVPAALMASRRDASVSVPESTLMVRADCWPWIRRSGARSTYMSWLTIESTSRPPPKEMGVDMMELLSAASLPRQAAPAPGCRAAGACLTSYGRLPEELQDTLRARV